MDESFAVNGSEIASTSELAVADLKELRVDLRSKETVELYLLITFDKEPPEPHESGWHHKSFPASFTMPQIFKYYMGDHLSWPIKNPPDVEEEEKPRIIASAHARA